MDVWNQISNIESFGMRVSSLGLVSQWEALDEIMGTGLGVKQHVLQVTRFKILRSIVMKS